MAIGINWAEVWGPVWKQVWSQTAPPVVSVAPAPVTSTGGGGGYRFFGYIPEPKKKKKVIEVGVDQVKEKFQVKYVSAPPQPDLPIELLQSVNDIVMKNEVRKKVLLQKLEEIEEEEDIKIIVRYLQ